MSKIILERNSLLFCHIKQQWLDRICLGRHRRVLRRLSRLLVSWVCRLFSFVEIHLRRHGIPGRNSSSDSDSRSFNGSLWASRPWHYDEILFWRLTLTSHRDVHIYSNKSLWLYPPRRCRATSGTTTPCLVRRWSEDEGHLRPYPEE